MKKTKTKPKPKSTLKSQLKSTASSKLRKGVRLIDIKTPKRYFRISDDSWEQITKAAHATDGQLSVYLRRVLLRDAQKVLKRGK
jgi:hypothetical protein